MKPLIFLTLAVIIITTVFHYSMCWGIFLGLIFAVYAVNDSFS
jgi:hypothetical protein